MTRSPGGGPESRYRPQLDGLRTFAVLVVLLYHFTPKSWQAGLPDGSRGVELFFVLSGFLISSILWRGRQTVRRGEQTRRGVLGRFLFRRTLRIFPIYYLTIAFAVVAGLGITLHEAKWFFSYLSNVFFVRQGHLGGPTSHLWSLAVEEQFYLLWPSLLLLLPRRVLLSLMGLAIVLAPAYRFWTIQHGLVLREILLPGCLDLFAMGAILAILSVESAARRRLYERTCLAASLLLWGLPRLAGSGLPSGLGWSLSRSAMGLLSVWLIRGADRGFSAVGRTILGSRPVVYLGKISYGIYLYHNFVAEGVEKLREIYGFPRLSPLADLLLLTSTTVGVAAASWHFIEGPLSRLKDRWSSLPEKGDRVMPGEAMPARSTP